MPTPASRSDPNRNLLRAGTERVLRVGADAGIDEEVLRRLSRPEMTLTASLSVRMDDGATRDFRAWRCRWSDALGPAKGGIRFHPEVTASDVEALALLMMVKCAVLARFAHDGSRSDAAGAPAAVVGADFVGARPQCVVRGAPRGANRAAFSRRGRTVGRGRTSLTDERRST